MRVDSQTGLVFHHGVLVRSTIAVRSLQIAAAIFTVIYLLLGIRFVLTYVGANRAAGFARFIWEYSAPFYTPFRGLLHVGDDGAGHPIEWSLLVALLTFAVLHSLVRKAIILIAKPRG